MCCATEGQSTVEAALLIPTFLLAVLLCVQPAIVLYDQMIMEEAAVEASQLLGVTESGKTQQVKQFVERRLSAVPEVAAFHEGQWQVSVSVGEVQISHSYRPLPLLDVGMGLVGLTDSNGLAHQDVRVAR